MKNKIMHVLIILIVVFFGCGKIGQGREADRLRSSLKSCEKHNFVPVKLSGKVMLTEDGTDSGYMYSIDTVDGVINISVYQNTSSCFLGFHQLKAFNRSFEELKLVEVGSKANDDANSSRTKGRIENNIDDSKSLDYISSLINVVMIGTDRMRFKIASHGESLFDSEYALFFDFQPLIGH